MFKYSQLSYLLALMLLCSCTSVREFSFDQLQPADVSFPEQIKNVAVVSTFPQNEEVKLNVNVHSSILGNQKVAKEKLAKAIADANYFENVILCDSIISRDARSNRGEILSQESATTLLEDLNADMLISIDNIKLTLNRLDGRMLGYPFDILQCIAQPDLKIYFPKKSSPAYSIEKSDTAYFDLPELIDFNKIVDMMSEDVVTRPVDFLIPHWKEVVRTFYTGGSYEMRDAEVAIKEDNWDEAFSLWKKIYDNKKGKIKAAAAMNIALYYETKDNIPDAMQWLDKAEALLKSDSDMYKSIQPYKELLKEREIRLSRLNIQMKRFQENK